MKITSLTLERIRGFKDTTTINFSPKINLLVGQNNSGKSTIINSLLQLQNQVLKAQDITLGESVGTVNISFDLISEKFYRLQNLDFTSAPFIQINLNKLSNTVTNTLRTHTSKLDINNISSSEPFNYIYPYLSKRKVATYQELINSTNTNQVTGDLSFLNSKIDRLSDTEQPGHNLYITACEQVLGFKMSAVSSDGGKKGALIVNTFENVPLASMGDGVANMLGLIVNLCIAENNLFLIEELENDIHPKALKALLELIILKSKTNQFIISTHSNIVVKYLGAVAETKTFKVSMSFDEVKPKMPVSTIKEIGNTKQERLELLEELGYEANDFELWKAWIFFEESSIEEIVRDYFFDWYCLTLKHQVRTYSAKGASEINVKFKDFNNLFVFLHLQEIYMMPPIVRADNRLI